MWSSSSALKAHLEEGKTARTFEGFGEDEDVDRVAKRESTCFPRRRSSTPPIWSEDGLHRRRGREQAPDRQVQAIADAEGADGAADLR